MTHHIKSTTINTQTREAAVVHFTDEEWALEEQARLDAEAAEASRDHNEEELDRLGGVLKAFIKMYAKREGLTIRQVKDAIKEEM